MLPLGRAEQMRSPPFGSVSTIPLLPLPQRFLNLLVGLVLAQRIHGPDGSRHPADQRELENEADDAGDGAADGKEHQAGQDQGDDICAHPPGGLFR